MINFRKIDPQSDADIEKYMCIREKGLKEDLSNYNLMTYLEEEQDYTIEGYKKYNYLNNYFVLEKGNIFIGYMAYNQDWKNNFQGNHNFSLGPVYIDSDFRGKGLGKQLLTKTIDDIIANYKYDIINLNLLVNKNSTIPINLYKSLGFKEVGIYHNYIKTKDGKYFDVIIMTKSYNIT